MVHPLRTDRLFFPAVDAHEGNAPNLDAQVDVDHTIIVASHQMAAGAGSELLYSNAEISGKLRKLLFARALGRQYNQQMANGDFLFLTADVRAGRYNASRALPPGASAPTSKSAR